MKYMDIHSHLGFEDYGNDLDEVIKRMKDLDVGTIAVGADLKSSEDAVRVAIENENVWACIGQHPNEKRDEIFDVAKYEGLIKNNKVVAVGECGLDYSNRISNIEYGISDEEKLRQKKLFEVQIDFAIKYNKPLMLHIRDGKKSTGAFSDALEILNSKFKNQNSTLRGNLHFFTSNLTNAKKFIEIGFTISFPGIITYIRDFDKVIKNIPLEMIHVETDAPFASPVPHRGERNEPSYIIEVVKKIAELRGEDLEMVRKQLIKNSESLFRL